MRVVFMGSPAFALPTLRALRQAGHEITLTVTRPDRPAGRARRVAPSAVAAYARAERLALYQPGTLRDQSAQQPIEQADPAVIVVAAFGLLLPGQLLDLPPLGSINVHPSLLPRHRGASPIQAALLAGDRETGVSIIRLTEQLDAGPILAQQRTPVSVAEDAPALEARLADIGADLLIRCLSAWAAGQLRPRPQDDSQATYCRRLERSDAELDWRRPADELARVVRAFRGRTDAFTYWNGQLLRVLRARPTEGTDELSPGLVFEAAGARPRRPMIATGRGTLELIEVALAGRQATSGADFLNGYRRFVGAQLGARSHQS